MSCSYSVPAGYPIEQRKEGNGFLPVFLTGQKIKSNIAVLVPRYCLINILLASWQIAKFTDF